MSDVLIFLVAAYLSGIAHELGHYAFGRMAGYLPTSVGVGAGDLLLARSFRGCRFYLGWQNPFHGLALLVHPEIFPRTSAMMTMVAGGIVVQLGLAVLCGLAALVFPAAAHVCMLVGRLNAGLAVVNLLPSDVRIGNRRLQTDGAKILALLRNRSHTPPTPAQIRGVLLWRPYLEAVGDRITLYWHLMSGALAWCELGENAHGEAWLREAEAVLPEPPACLEPFAAYVGAASLLSTERLPEARQALLRAAQCCEAPGRELVRLLIRMLEGELRLAEGEAAEAASQLDGMVPDPLLKHRPALAAVLLSMRLRAHLQAESPEAEGLLEIWERSRLRHRSPAIDCAVLHTLALARMRQERFDAAALAYDRLIAALQVTYHSFLGLPEAEEFGSRQRQVLVEAESAYAAAGRPPVKSLLNSYFPPPDEAWRGIVAARASRNLRLHRIGCWWAGVNLVVGALGFGARLAGLMTPLVADLAFSLNSLAVLQLLFGAIGLICGFDRRFAARWIPGLHRDGGMIVLAALPWILWGLFTLLLRRF